MTAIAAITCLAILAQLEIDIAPDQVMPLVYLDSPVIVEFRADADMPLAVTIDIESACGEVRSTDKEAVLVRANSPHWLTIDEFAGTAGVYVFTVRAESSSGQGFSKTKSICRIRRPEPGRVLPIVANVDKVTAETSAVLQGLMAAAFRTKGPARGDPEALQWLAAQQVRPTVFLTVPTDTGEAATFSTTPAGRTVWELDARGNTDGFASFARAIVEEYPVQGRLRLVTDDPETTVAFLRRGAGRFVSGLTLRNTAEQDETDAVTALRDACEHMGYESMPVYLLQDTRDTEDPYAAAKSLIRGLSAGALESSVAGEQLHRDNALTEAFVGLNALAQWLGTARPLGPVTFDGPAEGHLFTTGTRWALLFWATDDGTELTVPVGDAKDLLLTDHCGNSEPVDAQGGAVVVTPGRAPAGLSGALGDLVGRTAWATARHEARRLADREAWQQVAPRDAVAIVSVAAGEDPAELDRRDFFTLLTLFPILEGQWHRGPLDRSEAVPVIAGLARLLRAFCVLAQESGEPFIEPLQDTLAKCRDYQAIYLTSSSAASPNRERGDGLFAHVGRMAAEAQALADEGRGTEASALATLAEWRARALEQAIHASPLSDPPPDDDEDGEAGREDGPAEDAEE